ncbi:MAG: hypothetical protein ACR2RV_07350 [Verrucomicrobiales bacterium]
MDEADLKYLRRLSNSYHDVELLNLGLKPGGKGPYAVQQRGYPPGSETLAVDTYVLNKKGQWEIIWRWVSVSDEEKNDCLFDQVTDVLSLLERIAVERVVVIGELPQGVSKDQASKNYDDTGQRLIQLLRQAKPTQLKP